MENTVVATEELVSVKSSVIRDIYYNRITNEMKITFNSGKTYSYANVPVEVYEMFKKADSKGSFFSRVIKGRFTAEKI